jgi:putative hydrolase of the HAD superfamily
MKTFIFDYDDTLAPNQHYYSYAKLDLIKFILDRLGFKVPDVQNIFNRQVEIDKDLVKKIGFRKDRLALSFKQTYLELSRNLKVEDLDGANVAYEIGMSVFDKRKYAENGLFAGVVETLDFLVAKKDELVLFTLGDYEVQQSKIDATGIRKWFGDGIQIVERKDSNTLDRVVGLRNREDVWMVGNSMRSDILPAINNKIGAIYIPQETWAYDKDHGEVPKDYSRLITLDKVIEIKDRYDELF